MREEGEDANAPHGQHKGISLSVETPIPHRRWITRAGEKKEIDGSGRLSTTPSSNLWGGLFSFSLDFGLRATKRNSPLESMKIKPQPPGRTGENHSYLRSENRLAGPSTELRFQSLTKRNWRGRLMEE